jgi:hypothetical protein
MPDVVEAAEAIVEQVSMRERWVEIALWAYIGLMFGLWIGSVMARRNIRSGLSDLLDRF